MENSKDSIVINKIILLIEDKLQPLTDILLSIQTILANAYKGRLNNAPNGSDVEIRIIQLKGHDMPDETEHFERIKQVLVDRQLNQNMPKIGFQYSVLHIDSKAYPENCAVCAQSVIGQIQKYSEGKNFSIILDASLVDDKDREELLKPEGDGKILSQVIYEHYHENCIPYTNYDVDGINFRSAWENGVNPPKLPFERFCIDGYVTYKPFRELLFKHLKIGD